MGRSGEEGRKRWGAVATEMIYHSLVNKSKRNVRQTKKTKERERERE